MMLGEHNKFINYSLNPSITQFDSVTYNMFTHFKILRVNTK